MTTVTIECKPRIKVDKRKVGYRAMGDCYICEWYSPIVYGSEDDVWGKMERLHSDHRKAHLARNRTNSTGTDA